VGCPQGAPPGLPAETTFQDGERELKSPRRRSSFETQLEGRLRRRELQLEGAA
jgi:hypothetical protein